MSELIYLFAVSHQLCKMFLLRFYFELSWLKQQIHYTSSIYQSMAEFTDSLIRWDQFYVLQFERSPLATFFLFSATQREAAITISRVKIIPEANSGMTAFGDTRIIVRAATMM